MEYYFKLKAETYFGHGMAETVAVKLCESGFVRPGIVVDGNLFATAAVQNLLEALRRAELPVVHLLKARGNEEPDYDYLDQCANEFRECGIDCLIGIGGGSGMDLCKGIGVLLRNPGKGTDYRGMNKVKNPSLSVVLIATTAGSGSEATFTAVFTDKASHVKMGINGNNVGAAVAFLDSDFTASCPAHVAIGSGLDAMVHALEAFMTTRHNPIIWRTAVQAWVTLFNAFAPAVRNPADHKARLDMLLGSHLAGITLMYSGGGIAGALSYPLGGEYKVPHGLAGGVFLNHIIEANIAGGYMGYAELLDAIDPSSWALSPAEKSRLFLRRFNDLLAVLNAPADLRRFQIPRADIHRIVRLTLEQRNAVLQKNPVPVDERMLTDLLERVA